MGVVLSVTQPEVAKGIAKPEKKPTTTGSDILSVGKPFQNDTLKAAETEEDRIKYLSNRGPPTVLGPSPGNTPQKNNIQGCPTIKPPTDVKKKVDSNDSLYDTLMMTPDVDWSKKEKSLKSSKSSKSTKK